MCWAFDSTPFALTRITHKFPTAAPPSSALRVLRFLALLHVVHECVCETLLRAPCQRGVCGTSLQKPMHNPG